MSLKSLRSFALPILLVACTLGEPQIRSASPVYEKKSSASVEDKRACVYRWLEVQDLFVPFYRPDGVLFQTETHAFIELTEESLKVRVFGRYGEYWQGFFMVVAEACGNDLRSMPPEGFWSSWTKPDEVKAMDKLANQKKRE